MFGTVALLAVCFVALVQGYCSSTTGNFAGAYRGTIKSDSDGYGILDSVGATEVCTWTVTCPKDTLMAVTSVAADLQQDAVLSLWSSGSLLKKWTGSVSRQIWEELFLSNDTGVTVLFRANGYSSYGFDMNFACYFEPTPPVVVPFPVRTQCTNRLDYGESNEVFGTIAYYGYQNYSDATDCTWNIWCPSTSAVTFSNIRFDTEVGYDFLQLQSLAVWSSPSTIQSYSGRGSSVSNFSVYSNHARVQFRSDMALTGRGFSLDWGCGGTFRLPPTFTHLPPPPAPSDPTSSGQRSSSIEVNRAVIAVVICVFGAFVLMTVVVFVWMHRRYARLLKQHSLSSLGMAGLMMVEGVPQQQQSGAGCGSQQPLLVSTDQFPSYCGKCDYPE